MYSREYSIIYRGPSFLAVLWCGSSPTPSQSRSRQQLSLSFSVFLCVAGELIDMRGGRGGGNHSILSGAKKVPRLSNRDMIHHTPIFFCPTAACFDHRGVWLIYPTSPVIPRAFHVMLSQLLSGSSHPARREGYREEERSHICLVCYKTGFGMCSCILLLGKVQAIGQDVLTDT